jgi:hypothetical protein
VGKAREVVYSAIGELIAGPIRLGARAAKVGAKAGISAVVMSTPVVKAGAKAAVKTAAPMAIGSAETLSKVGAVVTWNAIEKSTKFATNNFVMRKGTYAENFMKGNIVPVKLKPLVGLGAVGAIGAYSITQGVLGYNEEVREGNNQIDAMEATGDLVFASYNNSRMSRVTGEI